VGPPIWPSAGAQAKADVRAVTIYDGPGGQALRTLTIPFGPQQSHPAFGIREQHDDWLFVDLPTRPNGSRGWIKLADVNIFRSNVSIDVDLTTNHMTVYDRGSVLLSTPVTTGTGYTPTPAGVFYVSDLAPNPGPPYGSAAFGLSAHSEVLYDFMGGDGQIAIHGTDEPGLMGARASHGCVRVTNDVASWLEGLLTIGVRVRIHGSTG
jgi:lipoprotein-anchoring transpeptidase ErfK/SrfK